MPWNQVMPKFQAGKLRSSSGQRVTNPKQAVAIEYSEKGEAEKGKSEYQPSRRAAVKMKTKKVDLGSKGSYTSHPGRLHEELGIPLGEKVGEERERKALKSSNPQTRRDAHSALGYAAMNKR